MLHSIHAEQSDTQHTEDQGQMQSAATGNRWMFDDD